VSRVDIDVRADASPPARHAWNVVVYLAGPWSTFHRRPMLEPHADLIRALVTDQPRITLAELQAALGERGIEVKALSTIWLMLRRLGLSHKKTRSAKLAGRPEVRGPPGKHPGCGGSGCAGSGHAGGDRDAGGVRSIARG